MVVDVEHPTLGQMKALGSPIKMSAHADRRPSRRAPMLGEHTDAVLRETGFGTEEIDQFRGVGAIG